MLSVMRSRYDSLINLEYLRGWTKDIKYLDI